MFGTWARGLQTRLTMETQQQDQPTPPVFPSIPASMTGAAAKKDEEAARTDKKDESVAADREIYDNVACTD